MEKVKEVINKVTHKDNHQTATGTTHHDTTLTGTHTGTHTGTTGTVGTNQYGATSTAGPHNSNLMNKMDPRVDSDMDGSRNMGTAQYGPGAHTTGTAGYMGSHDTAGPHNSNLMNKADPRVDSDLDGSRNFGAAQYGTGAQHNTNTSLTGSSTTATAGPHNSNLMNKADPRVDSDLDGSRNFGATQYGTGAHQNTNPGLTGSSTTTTAGPHNSNLMNKMDPRVDSDMDGSRNFGAAQHGTGTYNTSSSGYTAPHSTATHSTTGSANAGPHKSSLMNKLDPKVDSDMDGKAGFMK